MTVTVLAHGCWDGLHIGHIRHLQQAKQLGDVLVVGVTADEYVAKGPNRPRYKLRDRIEALKALRFVDEVIAVYAPDPCHTIRCLKPAVYVKGAEYAGKEIPERAVVASIGGRLEFVGDTLGSSSAVINAEVPGHPFLEACREKYYAKDVDAALEAIRELHVLVIGDHIFDRYIRCKPLGLTSKGAALSVEIVGRDGMVPGDAGGAAAIVGHARVLGAHVSYHYGPCVVEKTRWYMMAGDQVRVMFAQDERRATTLTRVRAQERAPDVILAADFGYGTVDPNALDHPGKIAIMCQSNSQNFGTNVLTRRYRRAGLFVVDDRELRLAAHTNNPTRESLLNVATELGTERAYWTRGQESTTSLCEGEFQECPALEDRPIDPLGAGDAFFAVASLCWAAKIPDDLSLLLAQIAGAQLTRVLGNARSLDREALIRTAKAILA